MIGLSGNRSRSSLYLVLGGIAAAVLAGFTVAYVGVGPLSLSRTLMTELWGAIVALVFIAVAAGLLVVRYLPFAIWSPVYGFTAVYLIIGGTGYVYYRLSTGYLGGIYDIGVSEAALTQALLGFLVALASFLSGTLVYLLLSRRFKRLNGLRARRGARRLNSSVIRPQLRRSGASLLVLLIILVPFLLYAAGTGPGNVWFRTEYSITQYHYVLVIGNILSRLAVPVIGYILLAKKNVQWRIACSAIFILYEVLFLSLSSRMSFVAPIFFIIGLAFGGARRRTIALLLASWVLALPLLFTAPLELRGMPEQGVVPLLSNLEEIFVQGTWAGYFPAVAALIENMTFGVPQAGYVMNSAPIPKYQFLTSLNPLPSFIIPMLDLPSWEDFGEQLRVTSYQPFSTLGELLNQGWLWLILFYAVAGFIAAWADIGARAFEGKSSRWGFLFACGVLDLFAIVSTQYNLRTSARLIYYAILIVVAWKVLCRIGVVSRLRYTLRSSELHTDRQVRSRQPWKREL